MNPAITGAMADEHVLDLRRQAARRQAAARHRQPRPGGRASRRPRLRSHLGFALVEAGCYLLSGVRLASRD